MALVFSALLVRGDAGHLRQVPFTCSYFPGKMNPALLTAFYLYGFAIYRFRMADFEAFMEHNPALGIPALSLAAAALAFLWRRKSHDEVVRFDGSEPEIQMPDPELIG